MDWSVWRGGRWEGVGVARDKNGREWTGGLAKSSCTFSTPTPRMACGTLTVSMLPRDTVMVADQLGSNLGVVTVTVAGVLETVVINSSMSFRALFFHRLHDHSGLGISKAE